MNETKAEPSQFPINQVLCGDSIEVMKTLPNDSIDMTMFSPPYWGLRDYGISGQIGLEEHPSKYIEKMVEVCQEVKRILKNTGSMYIVIGDTYFGGKGKSGSSLPEETDARQNTLQRGYQELSFDRPQNIVKQDGRWLQPKQLMGIPWRVAIALQEDGWILRNDIIWNKPNHMPSSVKDRLTNAYEHIFHFVKNRKYHYDLDAIREKPIGDESEKYGSPRARTQRATKCKGWDKVKPNEKGILGGAYGWQPDPHRKERISEIERNPLGKNPGDVLLYDSKYAKHDYGQTLQAFVREQTIAKRRILSRDEAEKLFPDDPKKQQEYINYIHDHDGHPSGKNPSDILKFKGDETQPAGRLAKSRDTYRALGLPEGHLLGKNPADFWNITTQPFKGAHFAVYPEAVCMRPIKSSCPPNGIVLDPMCGSGTTLVVAKKLGRKCIGVELNPAYIEIANKRLAAIPEKITTFF